MLKLARCIVLAVVLAGVPLSAASPFFTSAYGAPSWLPWFGEEAVQLGFDEMYSGASALGLDLSPKLKSLAGKQVIMTGFMAPPLKPALNFFVLTKVPMSICPFCSTDADWPSDIVVVKLSRPVAALPFDQPVIITGQLEIGSQVDNETGFVSLIRIHADTVKQAQ